MNGKVAKWWMPDDVAFVAEIPHTATGKIMKSTLRAQFKDYRLPSANSSCFDRVWRTAYEAPRQFG